MKDARGALNILVVSMRYPPYVAGGYELLTRDAVEGLRKRGHRVRVLCGAGEDFDAGAELMPWLEPALEHGADPFVAARAAGNLERFRLHFLRPSNWQATQRALASEETDVVCFFNLGLASLAPILAARCAGIPTLGYMADAWACNHWLSDWEANPESRIKTARLEGLRRLWTIFRDLVHLGPSLACSEILAQQLMASGVDEKLLGVLAPGLSPQMEQLSSGSQVQAREPGEPLRVICTSMLWQGKGQHMLLKGAGLAIKRGMDVRLTFCGGGKDEYRSSLKELEQVHAPGRVEWAGMLPPDQVSARLRQAHVFALPSLWPEPFGLSTIEGMAHGLAPIVSDRGASPEIVRAGKDGLVALAHDEESWAAALEKLYKDEGLRQSLAGAAIERVRDEFSQDAFLNGMEAALVAARNGGLAPQTLRKGPMLTADQLTSRMSGQVPATGHTSQSETGDAHS